MKYLVVVDGHINYAVLGQQFLCQFQSPVHEFQPLRMAIAVVFVDKTVVVNEIPFAGVVGRVNLDALHPPGVRHAQGAQRVEVVTLNN